MRNVVQRTYCGATYVLWYNVRIVEVVPDAIQELIAMQGVAALLDAILA